MDEAFAHMDGNSRKPAKRNLVAPDGGWGYIVCIGVGFTFVSKTYFSYFVALYKWS